MTERVIKWLKCCVESDETGFCPEDCPANDLEPEQLHNCERALRRAALREITELYGKTCNAEKKLRGIDE